jgi:hypothetical protein
MRKINVKARYAGDKIPLLVEAGFYLNTLAQRNNIPSYLVITAYVLACYPFDVGVYPW